MIDVSIILVNYNTRELTLNCISSIYRFSKDIEFEIIVSDNGSNDNSVELIKKNFPEVIILENNKNLGFGIANNRAAEIAKGKYLFFLNTDTILLNNAPKLFYQSAEEKKIDTIWGCYLYNEDNEIINSFGSYLTKINCIVKMIYLFFPCILKIRLKLKPINFIPMERNVDFVTGADLFILKKNFLELNGFDENIFMYCEDDDLCRRASLLNIKSEIIVSPKIIHLEGKSSKISSKKRKIMIKSYRYYLKKWSR